jgi:hypothetical protein
MSWFALTKPMPVNYCGVVESTSRKACGGKHLFFILRANMKWVNVSDGVPEDGEQVLVRYQAVVHLAVFTAEDGIFVLKDGSSYSKEMNVEWISLHPPKD